MSRLSLEHYFTEIWWCVDDAAFVARIPELPGCMADGKTRAEALEALLEIARLWIARAAELGRPIPAPVPRLQAYLTPDEVDTILRGTI